VYRRSHCDILEVHLLHEATLSALKLDVARERGALRGAPTESDIAEQMYCVIIRGADHQAITLAHDGVLHQYVGARGFHDHRVVSVRNVAALDVDVVGAQVEA
jgi:hypothetical protein